MTTATTGGVIPTLTAQQRLMIAREYAGLNQGELAERLDVSAATVYRAESGRGKTNKRTVMAWAMATGVNLYWLETGKSPHPDDPGGGEVCAIRDSNPEPADKKRGQVTPLRRAA